ncbi:Calmodulin-lysine N-methyltransferase [Gossypium arboreum]|uniref:Calmodulin-lysine N-methyltransferase n=1 Tax=Gossypium arboreum TaxID=29729 RepID=A0A0B0NTT2_GOSAR|nr:Calmodulin-lysine N-methyltransferase [Gossypium arboreum]
METNSNSASSKPSASSLRWRILSRAVLHRAKNPEDESQLGMKLISRKAAKGFNLIPCQLLNHDHESRDAQFCYTLPTQGCPKLVLTQRLNNNADLTDFEICNRHNIDNTGIVWLVGSFRRSIRNVICQTVDWTPNNRSYYPSGKVLSPVLCREPTCRHLLRNMVPLETLMSPWCLAVHPHTTEGTPGSVNQALKAIAYRTLTPGRAWETKPSPEDNTFNCWGTNSASWQNDTSKTSPEGVDPPSTCLSLSSQWPSEDVLAYYCLSHADMFRSKRVIELGSGYGLAGLTIAATTEALEVVISDGNPQVVDYILHNINTNSGAFGETRVKPMKLHWNEKEVSNLSHTFDVIVASDCVVDDVSSQSIETTYSPLTRGKKSLCYELKAKSTFFKEFHKDLAQVTELLLKKPGPSEAIFFSPKRGNSLDKFLEEIKDNGLLFSITEIYDTEIWNRHQQFMNGDESWPGYEKDHCYPLLIRITR